MTYIEIDTKCIFTDDIICIDGCCAMCEIFHQRKVEKNDIVQLIELNRHQITIEEYLNEKEK